MQKSNKIIRYIFVLLSFMVFGGVLFCVLGANISKTSATKDLDEERTEQESMATIASITSTSQTASYNNQIFGRLYFFYDSSLVSSVSMYFGYRSGSGGGSGTFVLGDISQSTVGPLRNNFIATPQSGAVWKTSSCDFTVYYNGGARDTSDYDNPASYKSWIPITLLTTLTRDGNAWKGLQTSLPSSNTYTYNTYVVDLTEYDLFSRTPVAKPTFSSGSSFTYTGSTITPSVNNYETTYMTRSGTYQATNVGNYSITYALKPGYCWTDDSLSDVVLNWGITKKNITIPSVSGSFTYDGTQKSATVSNMNSTYITQGGTASATNASTYTVTFTLKSTTNTQWSDGTTTQKSGTWTIGKASLTKPTIASSPTYTGSAVSPTLNNFDSSLMTMSGDTSAINVKTSGTYTITITLIDTANYQWVGGGTCTISWNVSPKSISGGTITLTPTEYTYDGTVKKP